MVQSELIGQDPVSLGRQVREMGIAENRPGDIPGQQLH
jgi:hypothetical protein